MILLLGIKVVLMTAAYLWIQYQLHLIRNCLSSSYNIKALFTANYMNSHSMQGIHVCLQSMLALEASPIEIFGNKSHPARLNMREFY